MRAGDIFPLSKVQAIESTETSVLPLKKLNILFNEKNVDLYYICLYTCYVVNMMFRGKHNERFS